MHLFIADAEAHQDQAITRALMSITSIYPSHLGQRWWGSCEPITLVTGSWATKTMQSQCKFTTDRNVASCNIQFTSFSWGWCLDYCCYWPSTQGITWNKWSSITFPVATIWCQFLSRDQKHAWKLYVKGVDRNSSVMSREELIRGWNLNDLTRVYAGMTLSWIHTQMN